MLILGVETSCDETSVAVVEAGRLVRSNVVSSQIPIHALYGGVVPEIASRHHVEAITRVYRQAVDQAGVQAPTIDAVAATQGPGLAGSLLVGTNFGRGLALALDVPFIPVNHLEGHVYSVWLTRDLSTAVPELPLLVLIVSGGHTELLVMPEHGHYRLLGRTVDDAAGEAFDKVARLLGLGYPGGPAIQKIVSEAKAPIRLPRAWLPGTYDFSFSGLKTAVLHRVFEMAEGRSVKEVRGQPLAGAELASRLTKDQIADVAAGFQESVVDVLVSKTRNAVATYEPRSVAVVGGVAANRALRERMAEVIDRPLFVSPTEFSTDNAAMIASAAFFVPRPAGDGDIAPSLQLAEVPA